jgi:iron(III) transport system ATP-binding protein
MSVLAIDRVSKRYPGASSDAVHDLSLRVEQGEVLALVGESGSGKTTLLRMIAGLETPTAGEIEIGGQIVCGPGIWLPPERRGVGLVFQDYALFPHLDVAKNVAYGLASRRRRERRERVDEVLALVGLENLADRYPHELSGGQQQRVALARVLAPEPTVVLLDEPFSNLDSGLKTRLRDEVGDLIRRTGTTAIFVLHDSEDALALGDRIAIMRAGSLWQVGTPQLVYARPRDGYVARFFGETNLLPACREPAGYQTPLGFHPVPIAVGELGAAVTIALYPEELELSEGAGEGVPATVIRSIFRGSHQQLTVHINGPAQASVTLQVYLDGCWPIDPGTTVHIKIRRTAVARVLAELEEVHSPASVPSRNA